MRIYRTTPALIGTSTRRIYSRLQFRRAISRSLGAHAEAFQFTSDNNSYDDDDVDSTPSATATASVTAAAATATPQSTLHSLICLESVSSH